MSDPLRGGGTVHLHKFSLLGVDDTDSFHINSNSLGTIFNMRK